MFFIIDRTFIQKLYFILESALLLTINYIQNIINKLKKDGTLENKRNLSIRLHSLASIVGGIVANVGEPNLYIELTPY